MLTTKCDCGLGSAPDPALGAYSASPAGFEVKGKGGKEKGKRERGREGGEVKGEVCSLTCIICKVDFQRVADPKSAAGCIHSRPRSDASVGGHRGT